MRVKISEAIVNKMLKESSDRYYDENFQEIPSKEDDFEFLYSWLKEIFGDKYLDAADSFMYMDGYYSPTHKKSFKVYKHFRTRRTLLLDVDGEPYKILKKNKQYNPVEIERISNQEAFSNIYSQLIKWREDYERREAAGENLCVDGVCLKPSFFEKQTDVFPLIMKQLEKAGYKVLRGRTPEDFEGKI